MTDGFRSRVATTVVPVDARDPSAFRSGLAEGLQEAGARIGRAADNAQAAQDQIEASQFRIAEEERRRRRSATIADRAGAWAEEQARLAADLDKLKLDSAPGAPDHKAKADQLITERLTGFLNTLGDDPEVRQRFEPLVAGFGAQARVREESWSIKARTEQEGANIGKWADMTGNDLLANPDPARLEEALIAADDLIGGLDVDGNTRAKLIDNAKTGFVGNFLDGLVEQGNTAGARALLDSGKLDPFLSPEQKQQFGRKIDNGEAVAARQAELQASQARDVARDAIRAVKAKIDAGIVPTPAEMQAARAGGQAAGLDAAELIQFDALDVQVAVNRQYAGQSSDQIAADRDALAARIATGKATERDQIMRAQLDKLADARMEEEVAGLRELAKSGPGGTAAALGQLTGTVGQRFAKAEKIEPGLGFIAALGPVAQQLALSGREARRARPKDFGNAGNGPDDEMKTVFDRMLGPVAATLGGDYDEVLTVARDIMIGRQVQRGVSGFDEGIARVAVLIATGGRQRPGGVIEGGVQPVRGRPVRLPPWMTAPEFDQFIARRDFGAARYGNGQPVSKDDVMRNYRPEFIGVSEDGGAQYVFVDAQGGALRDAGNARVVMTVRRGAQ